MASPGSFAETVSDYWIMAKHLDAINTELTTLILDRDRLDYRILVIEAPPRHGKSDFISKHLPVWYLLHYPQNRAILASYEANYARSWGRKARDLFSEVAPIVGLSVSADVAASYDWEISGIPNAGGMLCAGVGGPITGRGANLLIVDDYFKNSEQAISATVRDSIWEWWQSTAYTRLEPDGVVVIIATRWHPDGLIGRIGESFNGEKIKVVSLPAVSRGKDTDYLHRPRGRVLWPKRWPATKLKAIKNSIDTYWWNSLYQQSPTGYGVAEWPVAYFQDIYANVLPLAYDAKVLAVDPSKGKVTGDYCSAISSCLCGGKVYIDGFVERLPVEELVDRVLDLHVKYGFDVIGVEANAFQDLLAPMFAHRARQRHLGVVPITMIHNTTNKELRIRRIGPYLASSLLRFSPSPGMELLVKQLREYPNAQHDDGPDALEMALRLLNWLTKQRLLTDEDVPVML